MTRIDIQTFTPERAKFQLAVARYFAGPLYNVLGLLDIQGQENVPRQAPYLVVANHISYLDPPLLVLACERPMAFMAKQELFEKEPMKAFCQSFCAFPINRSHPEPSVFKLVRDLFEEGWPLAMFIEGTRSKEQGLLGHPNIGPAYFAHHHQVPIVPIGITGSNKLLRGQIKVKVGKIIEPTQEVEACTWQIMESLSQLTGFALPPHELKPSVPELHHIFRERTAEGDKDLAIDRSFVESKTWILHVKRRYIAAIADNSKSLEIRVGYNKIKNIRAGDTIHFLSEGAEAFKSVKAVRSYANIETMLKSEDYRLMAPGMSLVDVEQTMRDIYPPEKEALGMYVLDLQ